MVVKFAMSENRIDNCFFLPPIFTSTPLSTSFFTKFFGTNFPNEMRLFRIREIEFCNIFISLIPDTTSVTWSKSKLVILSA